MAGSPTIWAVGPLHNASAVPLSSQPGTLPMMADTLANWFQLIVAEKITKVVDATFEVVETTVPMQFQGVVFSAAKRTLIQMPNGQRLWGTKELFTWPTVILKPDDVFVYEGIQFRVMLSGDFKEYGYVKYTLLQDYTGTGPVGGR